MRTQQARNGKQKATFGAPCDIFILVQGLPRLVWGEPITVGVALPVRRSL